MKPETEKEITQLLRDATIIKGELDGPHRATVSIEFFCAVKSPVDIPSDPGVQKARLLRDHLFRLCGKENAQRKLTSWLHRRSLGEDPQLLLPEDLRQ